MVREKEGCLNKKIDTIVLDIDGVLVDVHASFKQAVCNGVEFYLEKFLNKKVSVLPEETVLFKLAGGFNNDWDLALAIVMYYRYEVDYSLKEYTEKLKSLGGGLKAVVELLGKPIDKEEQKKVADICQEVYAGADYCACLYGHDLEYLPQDTKPLLELEKILVDLEKLKKCGLKIGILTGRNYAEAKLVLARIGLFDLLERQYMLTDDDGFRKPDPACLDEMAKRLNVERGIFVGDTWDDFRTTCGTKQKWVSGIVLTGGGKREFFVEEGADIVADNINELLDAIQKAQA